jgi:hypothetical protein
MAPRPLFNEIIGKARQSRHRELRVVMKSSDGKWEPGYEHPVHDISWTTSVGAPAGVYWLGGRSLIAAHESSAEAWLVAQGAVLVATLRFDADPLEARHPGRAGGAAAGRGGVGRVPHVVGELIVAELLDAARLALHRSLRLRLLPSGPGGGHRGRAVRQGLHSGDADGRRESRSRSRYRPACWTALCSSCRR